ncbi:hypothetical protein C0995_014467, partial [Termitomyces sp. Mi166
YLLWVDPSRAIEPEDQEDAEGDVEIDSVYHGEVTTPSFLTLPQNAVSGKSKVEGWLMATPSQSSLSDMAFVSSHYGADTDEADTDKADTDKADTDKADTDNADNSSHIDLSNISHGTISTAKTAPDGKTPARIADFAIIYITPQPTDKFPLRYRGFRVDHVIVQVLVENKRYVKRSLSGDAHDRRVTMTINEAVYDILVQAAIIFRTTELKSVTAIVASGPYWSTCVLEPVKNNISNADFDKYLKNEQLLRFIRSTVKERKPGWSTVVRLGTSASDVLFEPIHNQLAQLEGRVTQ